MLLVKGFWLNEYRGNIVINNNPNWEKIYSDAKHQSIWPWSELVSLVMHYAVPLYKPGFNVLELGCGAGANIPFFQSLNASYHGIDISKTVVDQLHIQFPKLKEKIKNTDFCAEIPFYGPFDLVVDRGSLTHNDSDSIKSCLNTLNRVSNQNTLLIGVHWFSTECDYYGSGEPTNDPNCKTNFKSGNFVGTGIVHFSSESHLLDLLSGYEIISLQHITCRHNVPDDLPTLAYWNFVARRC